MFNTNNKENRFLKYCEKGKLSKITEMINNGFDPSFRNNSAVLLSWKYKQYEIFNFLLNLPSVQNSLRKLPLETTKSMIYRYVKDVMNDQYYILEQNDKNCIVDFYYDDAFRMLRFGVIGVNYYKSTGILNFDIDRFTDYRNYTLVKKIERIQNRMMV